MMDLVKMMVLAHDLMILSGCHQVPGVLVSVLDQIRKYKLIVNVLDVFTVVLVVVGIVVFLVLVGHLLIQLLILVSLILRGFCCRGGVIAVFPLVLESPPRIHEKVAHCRWLKTELTSN